MNMYGLSQFFIYLFFRNRQNEGVELYTLHKLSTEFMK